MTSLPALPAVALLWIASYFHGWSRPSLVAAQVSTAIFAVILAVSIVLRRRHPVVSAANAALLKELVGIDEDHCKRLRFDGVDFRLPWKIPVSQIEGIRFGFVADVPTWDESVPHNVSWTHQRVTGGPDRRYKYNSPTKITRMWELWLISRNPLPPFGRRKCAIHFNSQPNDYIGPDPRHDLQKLINGVNQLCRLGAALDYPDVASKHAVHFDARQSAMQQLAHVRERIRILKGGASAFDQVEGDHERSRKRHPERIALDRDLEIAVREEAKLMRQVAEEGTAIEELLAQTRRDWAMAANLESAYTARERAVGVIPKRLGQSWLSTEEAAEHENQKLLNSFPGDVPSEAIPSVLLIVVAAAILVIVGVVDVYGHLDAGASRNMAEVNARLQEAEANRVQVLDSLDGYCVFARTDGQFLGRVAMAERPAPYGLNQESSPISLKVALRYKLGGPGAWRDMSYPSDVKLRRCSLGIED